ncbi:tetratricopeptide repeat protein [Nostoc sp.]|uniref:tetratricopeptide repeat protein n=1 Tax=Nostoc sp. TaxID=1180 RepID=UPI002FFD02D7
MGEAKRRKKSDPNYGKFSKRKSEKYFNDGVTFEKQNNYEKAIDFYTKAIEYNPSNSEAYFGRANVYDELENYINAIYDYSEHIKISGGTFQGFNNRALVYMQLEQNENAISDFEQAIRLDSTRPYPYQSLGTLLWEQGKLTRSIELLKKALQLYQNDNNIEGYQTCLEITDEGETNLNLIRMARNDPCINEIDWNEFEDNSADLCETTSDSEENEFVNVEDDYECYGERAEYFKNFDFYLSKGGAFEEGLPKSHKYRSVRESKLFEFIQNAVDNEEQAANYILSQIKKSSDLTEIQPELLNLIDQSLISKRARNLNQAFKYYDQVFNQNQTWFMLWYGLAKLLCLFREYRMAFACIKICTYLYPKMHNGRQYHSDHNLSYHYDQIYSLAIAGEENEPYLKSLGRPLNTFRVGNSNGKIKGNSLVGRVKVIKP